MSTISTTVPPVMAKAAPVDAKAARKAAKLAAKAAKLAAKAAFPSRAAVVQGVLLLALLHGSKVQGSKVLSARLAAVRTVESADPSDTIPPADFGPDALGLAARNGPAWAVRLTGAESTVSSDRKILAKAAKARGMKAPV